MFPWRQLFDAYVAVTGAPNMDGFWKSSPKELFAWMEAISKRYKKTEDNDTPSDFWSEGEF